MGKRSNFERREKDYYPTPMAAILPLLPHLKSRTRFVEPCCGDGALIRHLETHGHICESFSDIEPKMDAPILDALTINECLGDCFITNPPWDRKILHPLIEKLSSIKTTILLFDADWMHTKQSVPYMKYCHKIISIGRVKWIENSSMTGKDNCCFYFFDQTIDFNGTQFFGRN